MSDGDLLALAKIGQCQPGQGLTMTHTVAWLWIISTILHLFGTVWTCINTDIEIWKDGVPSEVCQSVYKEGSN